MPHPGPCPSEQNLQRLLLGQLPDPDAERLEEHLGECDSCVQTVSTLKAEDTLAEVIRVQGAAPEMPTTEVVEELMQRMEKLRTSAPETTTATVQLTDTPSGGISVHAASPEGDPRAEAATLPPPAPAAAEATELVYDFLVPAQGPQELGRLGPYRVLKVLGTGGMGVVFEAEDPHLDRLVALKAMLPALASNPLARQRFLREAKAAAAIEHDHIIHINKVGEERGVPFLAMPLLKGEPLDDRLRRESKLPVSEVLRIGREVAEGLAAAHEHGLIHRDIKPGNIWLEGSRARVKILDFGLARAASDTAHLTQSGAIVGTPAYMAPEQTRGGAVDQRVDLFSLGCVLYRMATGEQPFKGTDTISILAALALDNPPTPMSLNAEVPVELSDLVMQLLAKKPEERPESAQVVVEGLQAIEGQTGESTTRPAHHARNVQGHGGTKVGAGPRQSPRQANQKSRLPWYVGGAVFGLGALGLLLFFLFRQGPGSAHDKQAGALPPKYTNSLGMEFALVPKGRFWMGGTGGKRGDKEVEIPHDFYLGVYEVTQEEWRKVTGRRPSHFSRTGHGKDTVEEIRDADLKSFPVENVSWYDAQLFLARLNERNEHTDWVYRLPTEAEWEYACRGGPLGDTLDSASDFYFDKATNVLLPEQANFQHEKDLKRTCKVGSYPPNRLGLRDMHGNVWEWCADEVASDPKDPNAVSPGVIRGGCWRADGGASRAASRFVLSPWFRDYTIGLRLARVPVGKQGQLGVVGPPVPMPGAEGGNGGVRTAVRATTLSLAGYQHGVYGVAFSPDGKRIAAAGETDPVKVWDAATGRELFSLRADAWLSASVAFSPDGKFLATGGTDQVVRVWDMSNGREIRTLRGNAGGILAVAFSPDGKRLASAGWDTTVRVWDAVSGKEQFVLRGHTGRVGNVAFSPGGKSLASGSADETVRVWDLARRRPTRIIKATSGGVAFSPDGKWLATGTLEGIVRVWDAATLRQILSLKGDADATEQLSFTPDGKRLASASGSATIRVWTIATEKQAFSLKDLGHHFAFSPDGRRLVVTSGDFRHPDPGKVEVWDLAELESRSDRP